MIWTLEIPGWQPVPTNELIGVHWRKTHKLKGRDREQLGLACKLYGVTPATGRRRVRLLLVLGKGERACDPDAQWKSLLDGLVCAGALVDDSRQWVEITAPKYARGERGTFVTLEDC